jgi:pyruvate/oxaloacetate carboxyltransferase
MGAVCGALEQSDLGTGIRYADIQALNLYWTQVRLLYSCFEANVRASDSSVFDHEMPGGQYTNLMVRVFLNARTSCNSNISVPSFPTRLGDSMGRWVCEIVP